MANEGDSRSEPRVRRRHMIINVGLITLALYVIVYATLSSFGRYAPDGVSPRGVHSVAWAPIGFYDANNPWRGSWTATHSRGAKTGGWNSLMVVAFYPLHRLDLRLIHNNPQPADFMRVREARGD